MTNDKAEYLYALRLKKYLIICIQALCFILYTGAYSQTEAIDSLNTALKNARHDTTRAALYVGLSERMYVINPDTVIPLSNKVLAICEKNLAGSSGQEKKSFLTARAAALNNIGYVHMNKGSFDEAIGYYNSSLKIRRDIDNKYGIANSLNNLGIVYDNQGKTEEALDHYTMALKMREELDDKKGCANCISNIGLIYARQGFTVKALEWYLKALKIREEIQDKGGTAVSLQNIAYVYQTQGDHEKALEWILKSLKLRQEMKDKQGIAYSLNMLGFIHSARPPFDTALKYYTAAYQLREELGDKRGMANSLNNIGSIYAKMGEHKKSLEHYLASYEIRLQTGEKSGVAYSLRNLATAYAEEKDYRKAAELGKEGLVLSQKIGSAETIRDISAVLSRVYAATGKYKEAYDMHVLFKQMSDSMTNVETKKSTVKKQMQYGFDKKQTADSIRTAEELKRESLKHEQQIQHQKTYTYGGIIGFFLMIIVAGVSFRAYRQKQKANTIINHQKELVEEKQKEILDSIQYARRIQQSLLPTGRYIERNLEKLKKNT
jgi:tetratricopeptide (TPR) repeat protein